MPRPMAEALGWPEEPLGFADILALVPGPGRAGPRYGHPSGARSGSARPTPTSPPAACPPSSPRPTPPPARPRTSRSRTSPSPTTDEFARQIESAVVHYGDTTLTFLNNWYRTDQRGNPLPYVSAVAVEEKSVIDYNSGNPDGVLQDRARSPAQPRVPLVAIYPEEGTLYSTTRSSSSTPSGSTTTRRRAPSCSSTSCSSPRTRSRSSSSASGPATPTSPIGDPDRRQPTASTPTSPRRCSRCPSPTVLIAAARRLAGPAQARPGAAPHRRLRLDGRASPTRTTGATKLDLAKQATIDALDEFNDDDEVGLWVFTTDLGDRRRPEDVPRARPDRPDRRRPRGAARRRSATWSRSTARRSTRATAAAYERRSSTSYDPTRINAVVLLSDGVNDDGEPDDDRDQLEELLADAAGRRRGPAEPGRARLPDLLRRGRRPRRRCAASPRPARPALYDSSDPRIDQQGLRRRRSATSRTRP